MACDGWTTVGVCLERERRDAVAVSISKSRVRGIFCVLVNKLGLAYINAYCKGTIRVPFSIRIIKAREVG